MCRAVIDEGRAAAAAVLVGEPGIGKTSVLRAAASVARLAGHEVLATTGLPSGSLPMGNVADLVGVAVRPVFAQLPGPQADALRYALGFSSAPVAGDDSMIVLAAVNAVRARRKSCATTTAGARAAIRPANPRGSASGSSGETHTPTGIPSAVRSASACQRRSSGGAFGSKACRTTSLSVVIDTFTAVTYNDPALTEQLLPTLRAVAGANHVSLTQPITPAEDFSRYQQRIPGVFFFRGITPPGTDPAKAAPNRSPRFFVDEAALPVGVKALAHAAVDYLSRSGK